MGLAVWLGVLCLQASLLSHALGCSGATRPELCVSGETADGQYEGQTPRNVLPLTDGLAAIRRRRQLEHRGPAHPSQARLPGAVTVRGFPNTLIQTDFRPTRQQVVLTANKRKSKRKSKSRAGSFSLLSNDKKSQPLQVIRAKRGMKAELSRRSSSGRSGAFSVLGDPQNDGQTDRPNTSTLARSGAK